MILVTLEISQRMMFSFLCLVLIFSGKSTLWANSGNKMWRFFAALSQMPSVTKEGGWGDGSAFSHTPQLNSARHLFAVHHIDAPCTKQETLQQHTAAAAAATTTFPPASSRGLQICQQWGLCRNASRKNIPIFVWDYTKCIWHELLKTRLTNALSSCRSQCILEHM